MVQYVEKYKRNIAADMRKRGFSYSEIEHRLHVPKSTLSWWLKDLPLTEEQTERLSQKRLAAARANSEKKTLRTAKAIEELRKASARDIRTISKRELWFMGIMLYWRERILGENPNDLRNGVRFTSSDPHLVRFFLKWLREIGKLEDAEITFDIFITSPITRDRTDKTNGEEKKRRSVDEAVAHWAVVTGFPKSSFSHIYMQKGRRKRSKRRTVKRSQLGLLRIRVKASSLLARQIAGWIRGIREIL